MYEVNLSEYIKYVSMANKVMSKKDVNTATPLKQHQVGWTIKKIELQENEAKTKNVHLGRNNTGDRIGCNFKMDKHNI